MTNSIIVIRSTEIRWHEATLRSECEKLAGTMKYKQKALHEDAPQSGNCVTAVNYAAQQTVQMSLLPPVWIGNMPRKLQERGCKVLKVPLSEVQTGDLIFVKEKGEKQRLATHAAIALSAKEFFHCCLTEKAGVIEKPDRFFTRYDQAETADSLVRYQDPRSDSPLPSRERCCCLIQRV